MLMINHDNQIVKLLYQIEYFYKNMQLFLYLY